MGVTTGKTQDEKTTATSAVTPCSDAGKVVRILLSARVCGYVLHWGHLDTEGPRVVGRQQSELDKAVTGDMDEFHLNMRGCDCSRYYR